MFNRRLMVFLVLVGAGLVVFALRLAQLQAVRGNDFAAQIEQSMRWEGTLPTRRGRILDRNGELLAIDQACYDVCFDYRALIVDRIRREVDAVARDEGVGRQEALSRVEDRHEWAADGAVKAWANRQVRRIIREHLERTGEELTREQARERLERRIVELQAIAAQTTGTPPEDLRRNVERVLGRVARIRQSVGTRVAEELQKHPVIAGLDDDDLIVRLRGQLDEPIAWVVPSSRRWYPAGDLACHIIGITGEVAEDDADPRADDPLRRHRPGDLVGRTGVERRCEDRLRGARGREVRGRESGEPVPEECIEPVPGQDVRLTIDLELQRLVTQRLRDAAADLELQAVRGSAVVIDVPTGEILAMVSLPTYDLNTYRQDFARLAHDEWDLPLLHRAIAGRGVPPGSTAKVIAALAALAEGLITPQTEYLCRGYLHVPTEFRCASRTGHGSLDLPGAIERSCNIYFYILGERLGHERLRAWMLRFGWGRPPGTGLPGEGGGLVPDAAELFRLQRRPFVRGDARQMAIGQGPVQATPLQVANLIATVARDGVYLSPRIVLDEPSLERRDLRLAGDGLPPLRPGDLRAVQDGMHAVVQGSRGTGRSARLPGVEICGKTGTAQASPRWVDLSGDGAAQEEEMIRGDMAWFAGYAPRRGPGVAVAVVLEHVDSHGGTACGPIARDIIGFCRDRGYLD